MNPVPAPSPALHTTRHSLQRLATHVIYLTRRDAIGRDGLCWTEGGFGTPRFGADEVVRVQGADLVHERAGTVRRTRITSLRDAAAFVGRPIDPDYDHAFGDVIPIGDVDEELAIDEAASLALGAWYGLGTAVLDQVCAERPAMEPSAVQLWPEHFDLATDVGYSDVDADRRVNVGFSAGDAGHEDPYLYVGPWTDDRPGDSEYWNASFGATLSIAEIAAAGTARAQHDVAVAFVHRGLALLEASD